MLKRSPLFPIDSSEEEPLINLTPLIDVVFVVLITFILIAPAIDIDGITLAEGGDSTQKEVQNQSIQILVKKDHSIWFRGSSIDLKTLEVLLKKEKQKMPKATPQLIHDADAPFGIYQSIKNLLESVGFEEMQVVLKPK